MPQCLFYRVSLPDWMDPGYLSPGTAHSHKQNFSPHFPGKWAAHSQRNRETGDYGRGRAKQHEGGKKGDQMKLQKESIKKFKLTLWTGGCRVVTVLSLALVLTPPPPTHSSKGTPGEASVRPPRVCLCCRFSTFHCNYHLVLAGSVTIKYR